MSTYDRKGVAMPKGKCPTTEVIEVTVTNVRHRWPDHGHYTVTFQEGDGVRVFEETYAWYGPGGEKAPKPYPGSKAVIHVEDGKVVYAGARH